MPKQDDPGQPGFAIWMTGLPASGKSTIRRHLVELLSERGVEVAVLESDELRRVIGGSYDDAGREAFYGAVVWIGVLLSRHGVPVIFDATANRRRYREPARAQIPRFMEVFVDTPLDVCVSRDPKGIYRRGREEAGGSVPGLHADYEPPLIPDLRVDGAHAEPAEAARHIVRKMEDEGFI